MERRNVLSSRKTPATYLVVRQQLRLRVLLRNETTLQLMDCDRDTRRRQHEARPRHRGEMLHQLARGANTLVLTLLQGTVLT